MNNKKISISLKSFSLPDNAYGNLHDALKANTTQGVELYLDNARRRHMPAPLLMLRGFEAKELKAAGYELKELLPIYSENDLLLAGFSKKQLPDKHNPLTNDRQSKDEINDMKKDGYTLYDIIQADFSMEDIKDTDFEDDIILYGVEICSLLEAYTVLEIKNRFEKTFQELAESRVGCSIILGLGYDAQDLKRSYPALKQLLSTNDPKNTMVLTKNYPATNMKQAGFTIDELLALHYDLKQIALA
ncbi:MAG: hypothetical protein CMF46_05800, partial [Legionellales bacterium]|nr:hypothetical protein [Legionellales bacterium]